MKMGQEMAKLKKDNEDYILGLRQARIANNSLKNNSANLQSQLEQSKQEITSLKGLATDNEHLKQQFVAALAKNSELETE